MPSIPMPRDPAKGHAALRRGRFSGTGAEYFLTICTQSRQPGLTASPVATAIMDEMHRMEADGTWQVRCALVMPDHLHLLVILGDRLPLSRAVARLKAKSGSAPGAYAQLQWQRGFFDHHIRPEDDRLSLFLYVFLNPSRAALCQRRDLWPWYYCGASDWAWFRDMLNSDRPVPEWLAENG
jgi:REP element-mobilizing transposase RayT